MSGAQLASPNRPRTRANEDAVIRFPAECGIFGAGADKRWAVAILLKDELVSIDPETGSPWSNREIARRCAVIVDRLRMDAAAVKLKRVSIVACRVDAMAITRRPWMADAFAPRLAVLLAEDDPLQLMSASAALREAGFDVAEASTVEAAQGHLAQRSEIAAMIADVDLGGDPLTGFTLAKAVAARWPEVAILIVSGVAWPGEGQMPVGAHFLPKPFEPEALVVALRTALAARGVGLQP